MKLVGSGEQQKRHYLFDASGAIVTGGTPQLVLPQHMSRSAFFFVNTQATTGNLILEWGAARATCSLSSGSVSSSFTITNAGFNYTKPPLVRFYGGGRPQSAVGAYITGPNTSYVGAAGPNFPSPSDPAQAHAVLTGGAVTSIVLDHPGSGYIVAPMLFMENSDLDPNGVAIPNATTGILLYPGGSHTFNATVCPTDAVSVYGATTGLTFSCKYMT